MEDSDVKNDSNDEENSIGLSEGEHGANGAIKSSATSNHDMDNSPHDDDIHYRPCVLRAKDPVLFDAISDYEKSIKQSRLIIVTRCGVAILLIVLMIGMHIGLKFAKDALHKVTDVSAVFKLILAFQILTSIVLVIAAVICVMKVGVRIPALRGDMIIYSKLKSSLIHDKEVSTVLSLLNPSTSVDCFLNALMGKEGLLHEVKSLQTGTVIEMINVVGLFQSIGVLDKDFNLTTVSGYPKNNNIMLTKLIENGIGYFKSQSMIQGTKLQCSSEGILIMLCAQLLHPVALLKRNSPEISRCNRQVFCEFPALDNSSAVKETKDCSKFTLRKRLNIMEALIAPFLGNYERCTLSEVVSYTFVELLIAAIHEDYSIVDEKIVDVLLSDAYLVVAFLDALGERISATKDLHSIVLYEKLLLKIMLSFDDTVLRSYTVSNLYKCSVTNVLNKCMKKAMSGIGGYLIGNSTKVKSVPSNSVPYYSIIKVYLSLDDKKNYVLGMHKFYEIFTECPNIDISTVSMFFNVFIEDNVLEYLLNSGHHEMNDEERYRAINSVVEVMYVWFCLDDIGEQEQRALRDIVSMHENMFKLLFSKDNMRFLLRMNKKQSVNVARSIFSLIKVFIDNGGEFNVNNLILEALCIPISDDVILDCLKLFVTDADSVDGNEPEEKNVIFLGLLNAAKEYCISPDKMLNYFMSASVTQAIMPYVLEHCVHAKEDMEEKSFLVNYIDKFTRRVLSHEMHQKVQALFSLSAVYVIACDKSIDIQEHFINNASQLVEHFSVKDWQEAIRIILLKDDNSKLVILDALVMIAASALKDVNSVEKVSKSTTALCIFMSAEITRSSQQYINEIVDRFSNGLTDVIVNCLCDEEWLKTKDIFVNNATLLLDRMLTLLIEVRSKNAGVTNSIICNMIIKLSQLYQFNLVMKDGSEVELPVLISEWIQSAAVLTALPESHAALNAYSQDKKLPAAWQSFVNMYKKSNNIDDDDLFSKSGVNIVKDMTKCTNFRASTLRYNSSNVMARKCQLVTSDLQQSMKPVWLKDCEKDLVNFLIAGLYCRKERDHIERIMTFMLKDTHDDVDAKNSVFVPLLESGHASDRQKSSAGDVIVLPRIMYVAKYIVQIILSRANGVQKDQTLSEMYNLYSVFQEHIKEILENPYNKKYTVFTYYQVDILMSVILYSIKELGTKILAAHQDIQVSFAEEKKAANDLVQFVKHYMLLLNKRPVLCTPFIKISLMDVLCSEVFCEFHDTEIILGIDDLKDSYTNAIADESKWFSEGRVCNNVHVMSFLSVSSLLYPDNICVQMITCITNCIVHNVVCGDIESMIHNVMNSHLVKKLGSLSIPVYSSVPPFSIVSRKGVGIRSILMINILFSQQEEFYRSSASYNVKVLLKQRMHSIFSFISKDHAFTTEALSFLPPKHIFLLVEVIKELGTKEEKDFLYNALLYRNDENSTRSVFAIQMSYLMSGVSYDNNCDGAFIQNVQSLNPEKNLVADIDMEELQCVESITEQDVDIGSPILKKILSSGMAQDVLSAAMSGDKTSSMTKKMKEAIGKDSSIFKNFSVEALLSKVNLIAVRLMLYAIHTNNKGLYDSVLEKSVECFEESEKCQKRQWINLSILVYILQENYNLGNSTNEQNVYAEGGKGHLCNLMYAFYEMQGMNIAIFDVAMRNSASMHCNMSDMKEFIGRSWVLLFQSFSKIHDQDFIHRMQAFEERFFAFLIDKNLPLDVRQAMVEYMLYNKIMRQYLASAFFKRSAGNSDDAQELRNLLVYEKSVIHLMTCVEEEGNSDDLSAWLMLALECNNSLPALSSDKESEMVVATLVKEGVKSVVISTDNLINSGNKGVGVSCMLAMSRGMQSSRKKAGIISYARDVMNKGILQVGADIVENVLNAKDPQCIAGYSLSADAISSLIFALLCSDIPEKNLQSMKSLLYSCFVKYDIISAISVSNQQNVIAYILANTQSKRTRRMVFKLSARQSVVKILENIMNIFGDDHDMMKRCGIDVYDSKSCVVLPMILLDNKDNISCLCMQQDYYKAKNYIALAKAEIERSPTCIGIYIYKIIAYCCDAKEKSISVNLNTMTEFIRLGEIITYMRHADNIAQYKDFLINHIGLFLILDLVDNTVFPWVSSDLFRVVSEEATQEDMEKILYAILLNNPSFKFHIDGKQYTINEIMYCDKSKLPRCFVRYPLLLEHCVLQGMVLGVLDVDMVMITRIVTDSLKMLASMDRNDESFDKVHNMYCKIMNLSIALISQDRVTCVRDCKAKGINKRVFRDVESGTACTMAQLIHNIFNSLDRDHCIFSIEKERGVEKREMLTRLLSPMFQAFYQHAPSCLQSIMTAKGECFVIQDPGMQELLEFCYRADDVDGAYSNIQHVGAILTDALVVESMPNCINGMQANEVLQSCQNGIREMNVSANSDTVMTDIENTGNLTHLSQISWLNGNEDQGEWVNFIKHSTAYLLNGDKSGISHVGDVLEKKLDLLLSMQDSCCDMVMTEKYKEKINQIIKWKNNIEEVMGNSKLNPLKKRQCQDVCEEYLEKITSAVKNNYSDLQADSVREVVEEEIGDSDHAFLSKLEGQSFVYPEIFGLAAGREKKDLSNVRTKVSVGLQQSVQTNENVQQDLGLSLDLNLSLQVGLSVEVSQGVSCDMQDVLYSKSQIADELLKHDYGVNARSQQSYIMPGLDRFGIKQSSIDKIMDGYSSIISSLSNLFSPEVSNTLQAVNLPVIVGMTRAFVSLVVSRKFILPSPQEIFESPVSFLQIVEKTPGVKIVNGILDFSPEECANYLQSGGEKSMGLVTGKEWNVSLIPTQFNAQSDATSSDYAQLADLIRDMLGEDVLKLVKTKYPFLICHYNKYAWPPNAIRGLSNLLISFSKKGDFTPSERAEVKNTFFTSISSIKVLYPVLDKSQALDSKDFDTNSRNPIVISTVDQMQNLPRFIPTVEMSQASQRSTFITIFNTEVSEVMSQRKILEGNNNNKEKKRSINNVCVVDELLSNAVHVTVQSREIFQNMSVAVYNKDIEIITRICADDSGDAGNAWDILCMMTGDERNISCSCDEDKHLLSKITAREAQVCFRALREEDSIHNPIMTMEELISLYQHRMSFTRSGDHSFAPSKYNYRLNCVSYTGAICNFVSPMRLEWEEVIHKEVMQTIIMQSILKVIEEDKSCKVRRSSLKELYIDALHNKVRTGVQQQDESRLGAISEMMVMMRRINSKEYLERVGALCSEQNQNVLGYKADNDSYIMFNSDIESRIAAEIKSRINKEVIEKGFKTRFITEIINKSSELFETLQDLSGEEGGGNNFIILPSMYCGAINGVLNWHYGSRLSKALNEMPAALLQNLLAYLSYALSSHDIQEVRSLILEIDHFFSAAIYQYSAQWEENLTQINHSFVIQNRLFQVYQMNQQVLKEYDNRASESDTVKKLKDVGIVLKDVTNSLKGSNNSSASTFQSIIRSWAEVCSQERIRGTICMPDISIYDNNSVALDKIFQAYDNMYSQDCKFREFCTQKGVNTLYTIIVAKTMHTRQRLAVMAAKKNGINQEEHDIKESASWSDEGTREHIINEFIEICNFKMPLIHNMHYSFAEVLGKTDIFQKINDPNSVDISDEEYTELAAMIEKEVLLKPPFVNCSGPVKMLSGYGLRLLLKAKTHVVPCNMIKDIVNAILVTPDEEMHLVKSAILLIKEIAASPARGLLKQISDVVHPVNMDDQSPSCVSNNILHVFSDKNALSTLKKLSSANSDVDIAARNVWNQLYETVKVHHPVDIRDVLHSFTIMRSIADSYGVSMDKIPNISMMLDCVRSQGIVKFKQIINVLSKFPTLDQFVSIASVPYENKVIMPSGDILSLPLSMFDVITKSPLKVIHQEMLLSREDMKPDIQDRSTYHVQDCYQYGLLGRVYYGNYDALETIKGIIVSSNISIIQHTVSHNFMSLLPSMSDEHFAYKRDGARHILWVEDYKAALLRFMASSDDSTYVSVFHEIFEYALQPLEITKCNANDNNREHTNNDLSMRKRLGGMYNPLSHNSIMIDNTSVVSMKQACNIMHIMAYAIRNSNDNSLSYGVVKDGLRKYDALIEDLKILYKKFQSMPNKLREAMISSLMTAYVTCVTVPEWMPNLTLKTLNSMIDMQVFSQVSVYDFVADVLPCDLKKDFVITRIKDRCSKKFEEFCKEEELRSVDHSVWDKVILVLKSNIQHVIAPELVWILVRVVSKENPMVSSDRDIVDLANMLHNSRQLYVVMSILSQRKTVIDMRALKCIALDPILYYKKYISENINALKENNFTVHNDLVQYCDGADHVTQELQRLADKKKEILSEQEKIVLLERNVVEHCKQEMMNVLGHKLYMKLWTESRANNTQGSDVPASWEMQSSLNESQKLLALSQDALHDLKDKYDNHVQASNALSIARVYGRGQKESASYAKEYRSMSVLTSLKLTIGAFISTKIAEEVPADIMQAIENDLQGVKSDDVLDKFCTSDSIGVGNILMLLHAAREKCAKMRKQMEESWAEEDAKGNEEKNLELAWDYYAQNLTYELLILTYFCIKRKADVYPYSRPFSGSKRFLAASTSAEELVSILSGLSSTSSNKGDTLSDVLQVATHVLTLLTGRELNLNALDALSRDNKIKGLVEESGLTDDERATLDNADLAKALTAFGATAKEIGGQLVRAKDKSLSQVVTSILMVLTHLVPGDIVGHNAMEALSSGMTGDIRIFREACLSSMSSLSILQVFIMLSSIIVSGVSDTNVKTAKTTLKNIQFLCGQFIAGKDVWGKFLAENVLGDDIIKDPAQRAEVDRLSSLFGESLDVLVGSTRYLNPITVARLENDLRVLKEKVKNGQSLTKHEKRRKTMLTSSLQKLPKTSDAAETARMSVVPNAYSSISDLSMKMTTLAKNLFTVDEMSMSQNLRKAITNTLIDEESNYMALLFSYASEDPRDDSPFQKGERELFLSEMVEVDPVQDDMHKSGIVMERCVSGFCALLSTGMQKVFDRCSQHLRKKYDHHIAESEKTRKEIETTLLPAVQKCQQVLNNGREEEASKAESHEKYKNVMKLMRNMKSYKQDLNALLHTVEEQELAVKLHNNIADTASLYVPCEQEVIKLSTVQELPCNVQALQKLSQESVCANADVTEVHLSQLQVSPNTASNNAIDFLDSTISSICSRSVTVMSSIELCMNSWKLNTIMRQLEIINKFLISSDTTTVQRLEFYDVYDSILGLKSILHSVMNAGMSEDEDNRFSLNIPFAPDNAVDKRMMDCLLSRVGLGVSGSVLSDSVSAKNLVNERRPCVYDGEYKRANRIDRVFKKNPLPTMDDLQKNYNIGAWLKYIVDYMPQSVETSLPHDTGIPVQVSNAVRLICKMLYPLGNNVNKDTHKNRENIRNIRAANEHCNSNIKNKRTQTYNVNSVVSVSIPSVPNKETCLQLDTMKDFVLNVEDGIKKLDDNLRDMQEKRAHIRGENNRAVVLHKMDDIVQDTQCMYSQFITNVRNIGEELNLWQSIAVAQNRNRDVCKKYQNDRSEVQLAWEYLKKLLNDPKARCSSDVKFIDGLRQEGCRELYELKSKYNVLLSTIREEDDVNDKQKCIHFIERDIKQLDDLIQWAERCSSVVSSCFEPLAEFIDKIESFTKPLLGYIQNLQHGADDMNPISSTCLQLHDIIDRIRASWSLLASSGNEYHEDMEEIFLSIVNNVQDVLSKIQYLIQAGYLARDNDNVVIVVENLQKHYKNLKSISNYYVSSGRTMRDVVRKSKSDDLLSETQVLVQPSDEEKNATEIGELSKDLIADSTHVNVNRDEDLQNSRDRYYAAMNKKKSEEQEEYKAVSKITAAVTATSALMLVNKESEHKGRTINAHNIDVGMNAFDTPFSARLSSQEMYTKMQDALERMGEYSLLDKEEFEKMIAVYNSIKLVQQQYMGKFSTVREQCMKLMQEIKVQLVVITRSAKERDTTDEDYICIQRSIEEFNNVSLTLRDVYLSFNSEMSKILAAQKDVPEVAKLEMDYLFSQEQVDILYDDSKKVDSQAVINSMKAVLLENKLEQDGVLLCKVQDVVDRSFSDSKGVLQQNMHNLEEKFSISPEVSKELSKMDEHNLLSDDTKLILRNAWESIRRISDVLELDRDEKFVEIMNDLNSKNFQQYDRARKLIFEKVFMNAYDQEGVPPCPLLISLVLSIKAQEMVAKDAESTTKGRIKFLYPMQLMCGLMQCLVSLRQYDAMDTTTVDLLQYMNMYPRCNSNLYKAYTGEGKTVMQIQEAAFAMINNKLYPEMRHKKVLIVTHDKNQAHIMEGKARKLMEMIGARTYNLDYNNEDTLQDADDTDILLSSKDETEKQLNCIKKADLVVSAISELSLFDTTTLLQNADPNNRCGLLFHNAHVVLDEEDSICLWKDNSSPVSRSHALTGSVVNAEKEGMQLIVRYITSGDAKKVDASLQKDATKSLRQKEISALLSLVGYMCVEARNPLLKKQLVECIHAIQNLQRSIANGQVLEEEAHCVEENIILEKYVFPALSSSTLLQGRDFVLTEYITNSNAYRQVEVIVKNGGNIDSRVTFKDGVMDALSQSQRLNPCNRDSEQISRFENAEHEVVTRQLDVSLLSTNNNATLQSFENATFSGSTGTIGQAVLFNVTAHNFGAMSPFYLPRRLHKDPLMNAKIVICSNAEELREKISSSALVISSQAAHDKPIIATQDHKEEERVYKKLQEMQAREDSFKQVELISLTDREKEDGKSTEETAESTLRKISDADANVVCTITDIGTRAVDYTPPTGNGKIILLIDNYPQYQAAMDQQLGRRNRNERMNDGLVFYLDLERHKDMVNVLEKNDLLEYSDNNLSTTPSVKEENMEQAAKVLYQYWGDRSRIASLGVAANVHTQSKKYSKLSQWDSEMASATANLLLGAGKNNPQRVYKITSLLMKEIDNDQSEIDLHSKIIMIRMLGMRDDILSDAEEHITGDTSQSLQNSPWLRYMTICYSMMTINYVQDSLSLNMSSIHALLKVSISNIAENVYVDNSDNKNLYNFIESIREDAEKERVYNIALSIVARCIANDETKLSKFCEVFFSQKCVSHVEVQEVICDLVSGFFPLVFNVYNAILQCTHKIEKSALDVLHNVGVQSDDLIKDIVHYVNGNDNSDTKTQSSMLAEIINIQDGSLEYEQLFTNYVQDLQMGVDQDIGEENVTQEQSDVGQQHVMSQDLPDYTTVKSKLSIPKSHMSKGAQNTLNRKMYDCVQRTDNECSRYMMKNSVVVNSLAQYEEFMDDEYENVGEQLDAPWSQFTMSRYINRQEDVMHSTLAMKCTV